MDWKSHYQRWINFPALDKELRDQLERLQQDPQKLADCFSQPLEFGTGGMRGELGPGTNRMNVYTVRKASEGLARYLLEQEQSVQHPTVVIAYDTRHKSHDFAMEAAKVITRHGIRVCLFDRICPTPLLSYAVRHLHASAGIVITASHNPPEYNGYKVYGADGAQIALDTTEQLTAHIKNVEDELTVAVASEEDIRQNGLLHMIGQDIFASYFEQLKALRPAVGKGADLSIVFTPLHGTTFASITEGLRHFGYTDVTIVQEQAAPDPDFSQVVSPNPEDPHAFKLAIDYAKRKDANLILATDPDGDRLGVAIKDPSGGYTVLTGNQVGAILLYYVLTTKLKAGKLPDNGAVVKTVVTSEMGRAIAADFGLMTIDTLTGFKYIGEKIKAFEATKEAVFIFGYEESCGYLLFDLVRDKDAVQTALILADACAAFQAEGKSLHQVLFSLYETYGYYSEDLVSLTMKGADGQKKIAEILAALRSQPFSTVNSCAVAIVEDYLSGQRKNVLTGETGKIILPASNMLKYILADETWFAIRPSGTEAKMKVYFGVKGISMEESQQKLERVKKHVMDHIKSL
ncbi:phospho-sugar mutase [Brevibacillus migulae]|uniref:phospho-sugar mutase n=1 Tax=Brevibacillus migulae TaxID=1644114 RepID=UPI00106EB6BB|nr:phospho-sugar mutase [Brevibacillus migulae]